MTISRRLLFVLLVFALSCVSSAQEDAANTVLTERGFETAAPAIVKLVSEGGNNVGAGVILAVHDGDVGFILTANSALGGQDRVAVILKEYPDPLLGKIVDRWVDFELDLAILGVRGFPADAQPITIASGKSVRLNHFYSILAHTEERDWSSISAELSLELEQQFILGATAGTALKGSPLLNKKGHLIGLLVTDETLREKETLTAAVKSEALKPVLHEWFRNVELGRKWQEKGAGIASWMWAVGGGVLGGSVATAIALTGEDDGAPRGLPRPPDPPPSGQ